MDESEKIRVNIKRSAPSAPPVPRGAIDGMRPMVARNDEPRLPETAHNSEPGPMPDGSQLAVPLADSAAPVIEAPDEPDHTEADSGGKTDAAASDGATQRNVFRRLLGGYWRRKWWTLPLTVLVLVAAVLAVPASRYPILALFVSKPYSVTVTDSSTGLELSGVTIKLGSHSAQTDSKGHAALTVPVGNYTLTASKTYYRSVTSRVLVDVMPGGNASKIKLVATGRQIPIKVINRITGAPIPEVLLTFANTNAKTGVDGAVVAVLPASPDSQTATLSVDGYNDLAVTVNASADAEESVEPLAGNTFAMVPKGRVFFLSNLSGKLDVVSTNLDGSDRKTVLAGTGSEDRNNTVLLASRDWQYLALLSKRDGGTSPKLYLINTSNGQLTTIDSTAGDYELLGWNNHYFTYVLDHPEVQTWQPGKQTIVSYNADSNKSVTLAATKATGTSTADAQYQTFNGATFLGGNLIFAATWYAYPGNISVPGQQNTLMSVKVDGTGSKTLKSVDAGTLYISGVNLADPADIYFGVYGASSNYFRLDSNQNVTQSSTITADQVNQTYPTYLLSPSGKFTFWTSVRDGKNTLFVGDQSGSNGNQIASLSDYAPYGWYTDDYILVQKNKSELYILPATDSSGSTPLKISDYFKPDYYIYGYGGGYGGL